METDPPGQEDGLHSVHFLPPITLHFELPPEYPSTCPPTFTLSCQWLSLQQLSALCGKLDEIWQGNEGEVVLFSWTSFLQDEALDFLHIHSPLDLSDIIRHPTTSTSDSTQPTTCPQSGSVSEPNGSLDRRAHQDIASQDLVLRTILEYDRLQREAEFNRTLFTCEVCFSEKLGAVCSSFPDCNHVFCKECMQGYFEVQIADGNVKGLTCPADKCESQAHPSQVRALVSADLFARYDRLLLQCSLDMMSDVLYCPRPACGCAVLVDSELNTGSCPACSYVFCIFCKQTSHGVAPCKVNSADILKLREQYLSASGQEKKVLEKRYGRRTIQHLIEDSFTQDWLTEFTKNCPHCNTSIQKVDGCNKMTCTKCHTYFCWLCQRQLSRANPYLHFNRPDQPCFNKLFEGVIMDGPDVEELEAFL